MSAPLIVLVTVIYAAVGINEALQRNYGMACVFAGYAFANCGLIWSMAK